MAIERILTAEERGTIQGSLRGLRQMKNFSTKGLDPSFFGLFTPTGSPEDKWRQQPLQDAEVLAQTTAAFLVARINRNSYTEEYVALLERLLEAKNKYGKEKKSSYSGISTAESTERIAANLLYLSIDPRYVMNWHLTHYNNVGYSNLDEFLRHDIGVFSPLASDYLTAVLYQKYLQESSSRSFSIKPAAASSKLRGVVLPVSKDGKSTYKDKPEIAVFLDIITSGSTGEAVLKAIRQNYPDKTIHEFDKTQLPEAFEPSQKIRRELRKTIR